VSSAAIGSESAALPETRVRILSRLEKSVVQSEIEGKGAVDLCAAGDPDDPLTDLGSGRDPQILDASESLAALRCRDGVVSVRAIDEHEEQNRFVAAPVRAPARLTVPLLPITITVGQQAIAPASEERYDVERDNQPSLSGQAALTLSARRLRLA